MSTSPAGQHNFAFFLILYGPAGCFCTMVSSSMLSWKIFPFTDALVKGDFCNPGCKSHCTNGHKGLCVCMPACLFVYVCVRNAGRMPHVCLGV